MSLRIEELFGEARVPEMCFQADAKSVSVNGNTVTVPIQKVRNLLADRAVGICNVLILQHQIVSKCVRRIQALFAGTFDMARSVMALIVNDGFTPGFAGTTEPSQIIRF